MNPKYEKYLLLLCFVGAILSLYIYYTDVVNIPTICPNNGCAQVAASAYSRFLGIHVSLWGLLYYVAFAMLFMAKDMFVFINNHLKQLSGLMLSIGIAFTIYLRIVEYFYIHAICIWCWGSVLVMVLLTITYFLSVKGNVQKQIN